MLAQVAKIPTERAFKRLALVYRSPLSSLALPIGEFLTRYRHEKILLLSQTLR